MLRCPTEPIGHIVLRLEAHHVVASGREQLRVPGQHAQLTYSKGMCRKKPTGRRTPLAHRGRADQVIVVTQILRRRITRELLRERRFILVRVALL